MSLLGGLGAAIGGLLGFAGQESANDAQMDMLERQIEWQREVLQNKVQWNVQDMRAAGLNPVLSVMGSGGASGSAPSVSAPQVQNPVQAMSSSALAVSQIINQFQGMANETRLANSQVQESNARSENLAADTKNKQAFFESGLLGARTENERASALQSYMQIGYLQTKQDEIRVGMEKTRAEIDNLEKQKLVLAAQVEYLLAQSRESGSRVALNEAERQYKQVQARLVDAQRAAEVLRAQGIKIDNDLKELGKPRAEFDSQYWDSSGGRYFRGLGNAFGELGRLFSF